MTDQLLTATGYDGTVELTDAFVRIKRTSLFGTSLGDKDILISQISSVQFRGASFLANGYIEFAFIGGGDYQAVLSRGYVHENRVGFTRKQQPAFEVCRDAVLSRISGGKAPAPASSAVPAAVIGA